MGDGEMRGLKLYTNREVLALAGVKRTKSKKHFAPYVPVCVVSKRYTRGYVTRYLKVSDVIDYTSNLSMDK